jgi:hypothetical protein
VEGNTDGTVEDEEQGDIALKAAEGEVAEDSASNDTAVRHRRLLLDQVGHRLVADRRLLHGPQLKKRHRGDNTMCHQVGDAGVGTCKAQSTAQAATLGEGAANSKARYHPRINIVQSSINQCTWA